MNIFMSVYGITGIKMPSNYMRENNKIDRNIRISVREIK